MEDAGPLNRQKAELEAILASETFRRAPNLGKLLRFLCQKSWEGKAADIKEYMLAVEVLGRPADFDPATNSIVRVELHRLREKLNDYYQHPGHHPEFNIRLRSGSYIPEFFPVQNQQGQADTALPPPPPSLGINHPWTPASKEFGIPASPSTSGGSRGTSLRFSKVMILAIVSAGALLVLSLHAWRAMRVARAQPGHPLPAPSSTLFVPPAHTPETRILAGYTKGKYYLDRLGHTWLADRYFEGGEPLSFPRQVTALAADPGWFETGRLGRFTYSIPLAPGSYELRLYFMERIIGPGALRPGGESSRIFDVLLNGKPALVHFDPYSEAGGNLIGHIRAFKGVTPGPDGYLRIQFTPNRDEPFVNALEVIPTPDGRATPIRVVAQENSVTDSQGRSWQPDQYYRAGTLLRRPANVVGNLDPDLFAGERFGHFSYVIPVPDGVYGLTLYFAEAYFGTLDQGFGGRGSRLFDLHCNGEALLRNLDVFREAGGPRRALVKSFHGLRPNPQGQLHLDFVPRKNYALLNALEVVDESPR